MFAVRRLTATVPPAARGLAAGAKKNLFDLSGRVAIVTGAATGIGRAAAMGLADAGAKVVIGDWNVTEAEKTAADIRKAGGEAAFVKTDVSKDADVKALVDAAVAQYGRLDIAFNNAGVAPKDMVPIASVTDAEYDRIMNVNVRGVFHGIRHQVPAMAKTGGGSIINTASIAGINGSPGTGAYTLSKHAIIGLTRQAAVDHAKDGIRVNAIAPGVVITPMVEAVLTGEAQEAFKAIGVQHRFGDPRELVSAVLMFASPSAGYTTGATLVIDGGHTAKF
jgi:NAD(P)-dependent dehydrogenase (short-subunit alcohol dehydrogenase family)